jgi:hypothetical protein
MQAGTCTGPWSPERTEETLTEKTSGRCAYCGNPADGVDARERVSICEACAETPIALPDGGIPKGVVGDIATAPETEGFVFVARKNTGELFSLGGVDDKSGEQEAELIASYLDAMTQRTSLDREAAVRLVVAKLNEIPKDGWEFEEAEA